MNKTKEEIFTKEVSPTMEGLRQQLKDAGFLKHVHELMNRFADQETSHLTDQIKSMEGQVKELREENEIQGNYNDMLIKELESLQKENTMLEKNCSRAQEHTEKLLNKFTTSEAKNDKLNKVIDIMAKSIDKLGELMEGKTCTEKETWELAKVETDLKDITELLTK